MITRDPRTRSLQTRLRAAAVKAGKDPQQVRRELLHQRILARVFDWQT